MKTLLKTTAFVTVFFTVGAVLHAQSVFTNLYNFSLFKENITSGYNTNSDGAEPFSTLVLSGNTLYGTTVNGGIFGLGTVFAINTDGSGFTNLYNFTIIQQDPVSNQYTNYDGANPTAGLALSNGILYGVTSMGGAGGFGSVFAINVNGTGFTNLYSFQYSTGAMPEGALMVSGNTLYGTTTLGGSGDSGTVFRLGADGSKYTNIYNFASSDGAQPYGTLVLSGDMLYGTTSAGGVGGGGGTVFRVNTDGNDFTNLVNFQGRDGGNPYGGLVLSGNTLFGTTELGGTNGAPWGTIFSINTDGSGFVSLHSLDHNNDGAEPYDALFLSGNTLYGTTYEGGLIGAGTVFKMNTDGSSFSNLYNFPLTDYNSNLGASTNSDGAAPKTGLVLSGGTLYGTAAFGGTGGSGVIFALSAASAPTPIPLNIARNGGNVVLSWSDPTFLLYSAQVVGGPYTNIPGATSPCTNPIAGSQQYFRLQAAP
jgi:uncharacterized repeat protein (TIGR03803 family)